MAVVVKNFIHSGMTIEQTATRMDVSIGYVKSLF